MRELAVDPHDRNHGPAAIFSAFQSTATVCRWLPSPNMRRAHARHEQDRQTGSPQHGPRASTCAARCRRRTRPASLAPDSNVNARVANSSRA
jgi:hypothetical protein